MSTWSDQVAHTHQPVVPSPSPPKDSQDEMAPKSSTSKQKAVEMRGHMYPHKIGPVTSQLNQDCLGKLVSTLSDCLCFTSSWKDFIKDHWGKSYLAQEDIDHIDHTAHGLLQGFRDEGVCASMDDPPWRPEMIDHCTKWGPHPLANLHWDFLWDEMLDFIDAGFWVVLPLEQVQELGKDLHLSPLVVKEEIKC